MVLVFAVFFAIVIYLHYFALSVNYIDQNIGQNWIHKGIIAKSRPAGRPFLLFARFCAIFYIEQERDELIDGANW